MKIRSPSVYHIASTSIHYDEIAYMLKEEFNFDVDTDSDQGFDINATSDGEALIELAGRLCYKSFKAGLNPNVTKVRPDSRKYFENILKSKHGSVLEHAYDTFAICGCSRVFTHEVVRHRLCNFSQESLRYVRLTDLTGYYPAAFETLSEPAKSLVKDLFVDTFTNLEQVQKTMAEVLDLDNPELSFHHKKAYTSAMRRLAPIGLGTHIIVTTNHRNWRHLLAMRTSEGAEEEIRMIFTRIGFMLRDRYPEIYQDMHIHTEHLSEFSSITFDNEKV